MCWFNQIIQGFSFVTLCYLMDWGFPFPSIPVILWGFEFVFGCDLRFFQDFQVSGAKKCCFAVLVCSTLGIFPVRQSDPDHLLESYWALRLDRLGLLRSDCGELGNLRVFFDEVRLFRCVSHSDCYCLPNYRWHLTESQQTCGFCEILQRGHSACCIRFWWMISEGCEGFRCQKWFCLGVTN